MKDAKHPAQHASSIRALSDSELEAVAGGAYVDRKKPKDPIIIIDFPIPPPLPMK